MLTLWAAVVAERLGFDRDAAVTLGRAVAGRTAAAKAVMLGLAERREPPGKAAAESRGRKVEVSFFGRTYTAIETPEGLREAYSLYESVPARGPAVCPRPGRQRRSRPGSYSCIGEGSEMRE